MPRVYNMPRPIAEVIPSDWETKDAKEFLRGSIPHYMMGSNDNMTKEITDAILLMNHADTLGSIMKFDISESTRNAIMVRTQEYEQQLANGEFVPEANQLFIPYMNIILALTDKYAAICMNPPYMGSGRFDSVLSKYVKDNYPRSKADLFSVFMDVATDRLMPNGKYGMINMHSWMFLSSFEELRRDLLDNYSIDSLLHLGPRTFDELSGEVVQNAAFVISNSREEIFDSPSTEQLQHRDVTKIGTYFRLVDGKNCADKERLYLEALEAHTEKVYYAGVEQTKFYIIPELRMGYWITQNVAQKWEAGLFDDEQIIIRQGLASGDNERFVRTWFEISQNKFNTKASSCENAVKSGYKWFPFHKGGESRSWYGNSGNVISFDPESYNALLNQGNHLPSKEYYFSEGVLFSRISSKRLNAKYTPSGFVFDGSAPLGVAKGNLYQKLGYMCSNSITSFLQVLAPTLTFQVGDVRKAAYISTNDIEIENRVKENVNISRLDWDSHETSWDFQCNELVSLSGDIRIEEEGDPAATEITSSPISLLIREYHAIWEQRFNVLHKNEEELNRQFIEIYGLQDELTPDVPLDEITILQQGEISIVDGKIKWNDDVVMKQLISYAVGCMMGRYSIDKEGLILANQGDGQKEYAELVPNSRFEVDDDGIIPLMASDTDFADNATLRFKQWLSVTFGEDTLVENLNFIEGALGKNLDDYFVKDFWKDHKKMYQNRPIYWLFSSKKGAFQCLTYMHRMNPYTAESIRTKYLLPHIEWLLQKQSEMEANAANLTTAERRKLDTITKQIEECREYHDRLHVIADQQIGFDLDDGVVVNYAKFGDVLQKLK